MAKITFSNDPRKNSEAVAHILHDVETTHGEYCTPGIRAVQTASGIKLYITLVPIKDHSAPNAHVGELDIQPGLHDSEVIARDVRELLGEYFADDISRA